MCPSFKLVAAKPNGTKTYNCIREWTRDFYIYRKPVLREYYVIRLLRAIFSVYPVCVCV